MNNEMGGGLLPAPIYLCGAAYLTRVLARPRFQFVRKENRWAASLDLIPFKEEVRGSNPLRATDRVVIGSYAPGPRDLVLRKYRQRFRQ